MRTSCIVAVLAAACAGPVETDTEAPCLLAEVTVTPAELDFGEVKVGHRAVLELDVRNTGCFELQVLRVEPQVGSAPEFSVVTDVSDHTLLLSQGMAVELQFYPAVLGSAAGTMDVVTDVRNDGTKSVTLRGTGI